MQMTAEYSAGAVSHTSADWHSIPWKTVNETVRRLHARIVQATKDGRWGKVKALQRLLTRSFSGKALAVRRVTENQGKRTPGVDNRTWNDPRQKAQALHAAALRQLTERAANRPRERSPPDFGIDHAAPGLGLGRPNRSGGRRDDRPCRRDRADTQRAGAEIGA